MGSNKGEKMTVLLGIGRHKRSIEAKIEIIHKMMVKAECYAQKIIVDEGIGLFRITLQSEKPLNIEIENRKLTKEEYANQDLFDFHFEL